MTDSITFLIEKDQILDVINRLFIGTNYRDWPAMTECFADMVLFDMTLMAGGEPAGDPHLPKFPGPEVLECGAGACELYELLEGRSVHSPEIWRIICTELWLEQAFDRRTDEGIASERL